MSLHVWRNGVRGAAVGRRWRPGPRLPRLEQHDACDGQAALVLRLGLPGALANVQAAQQAAPRRASPEHKVLFGLLARLGQGDRLAGEPCKYHYCYLLGPLTLVTTAWPAARRAVQVRAHPLLGPGEAPGQPRLQRREGWLLLELPAGLLLARPGQCLGWLRRLVRW